jgi:hypothetical protein
MCAIAKYVAIDPSFVRAPIRPGEHGNAKKRTVFWSASGWAKRRASSGSASITIARLDTNF